MALCPHTLKNGTIATKFLLLCLHHLTPLLSGHQLLANCTGIRLQQVYPSPSCTILQPKGPRQGAIYEGDPRTLMKWQPYMRARLLVVAHPFCRIGTSESAGTLGCVCVCVLCTINKG